MQYLAEISGLPISLDGWRIIPESQLHLSEPAVRRIDDLREVMLDPRASVKPSELYFVYWDVHLKESGLIPENLNLRYDLMVIRPGLLGREYIKTVGHYHPSTNGSEIEYPEIYEVLMGKARYLLQKIKNEPSGEEFEVEDVILIEANPGDKIIVPPGYGHVIINPGIDPLVVASLSSTQFTPLYEPMIRTHGAAYFMFNTRIGYHLVSNTCYASVPEPRIMKAKEIPELGISSGNPLYTACMNDPKRFDWLNHPASSLQLIQEYYHI